jgi:hypothetical protein
MATRGALTVAMTAPERFGCWLLKRSSFALGMYEGAGRCDGLQQPSCRPKNSRDREKDAPRHVVRHDLLTRGRIEVAAEMRKGKYRKVAVNNYLWWGNLSSFGGNFPLASAVCPALRRGESDSV